jgi:hypothetical protein
LHNVCCRSISSKAFPPSSRHCGRCRPELGCQTVVL